MTAARLAAVGFGTALLLALIARLSPELAIHPVAAYVIAFSFVSVASVAAGLAAAPLDLLSALFSIALGGAAIALALWLRSDPPQAAVPLLVAFGLLLAGAAVGALVGSRIEHPGHLLPAAVVSSMADLWSVLHPDGPTGQVIAKRPDIAQVAALPFPDLTGGSGFAPVLGVGDVVFAALYLAAARRHDLGQKRIGLALLLGLLCAMASVLFFERSLPALPMLGAAVLIAAPRARRLAPADLRHGIIAMGATALLFVGMWLWRG